MGLDSPGRRPPSITSRLALSQSLFSEPQDGKALSFVNAWTKRLGCTFAWDLF